MVITTYLQALSKLLYIIPLANAHYNILINPTTVTCFNCGKDSYLTMSYLELKDIGNIKEIEEEEMFNKLRKKEL